jgi:hypothetical protein
MFNCLPGAMLQKGHTHQCPKGFSCSRVPSQHNARMTASHRLFNPGLAGGQATMGLHGRLLMAEQFRIGVRTSWPYENVLTRRQVVRLRALVGYLSVLLTKCCQPYRFVL